MALTTGMACGGCCMCWLLHVVHLVASQLAQLPGDCCTCVAAQGHQVIPGDKQVTSQRQELQPWVSRVMATTQHLLLGVPLASRHHLQHQHSHLQPPPTPSNHLGNTTLTPRCSTQPTCSLPATHTCHETHPSRLPPQHIAPHPQRPLPSPPPTHPPAPPAPLQLQLLDARGLRRLVLTFERKYRENLELRSKWADQPDKFLDSEVDLDEQIKSLMQVRG
jgi:hypothetical protein